MIPQLHFRDVSASYGHKVVLQNINLVCVPGEILALVGPNGSGKSTVLKVAHGLIPYQGTILIGSEDLSSLTPAQIAAEVATVPQFEFTAFPFTVYEFVLQGRTHALLGYGYSQEDEALTNQAIERLDLKAFAQTPVTQLSGGELQRVWMARALAQNTNLLLLDEPTSHLDAKHVLEFLDLCKELKQKHIAIVAAVHDLNLALEIADRIAILKQGKVVYQGIPEESHEALEEAYEVQFERSAEGFLRAKKRF
jgi:ABC-type cobalamin/Fe3+-siderophores transport system ATPase subunit